MVRITLNIVLLAAVLGLGAAPVEPAMSAARPGAVKPAGWLRDRALAAKNGFTGHMDEVDEHFRLAWTTNCMRRGARLNWEDAHRGSWSAEGGAYWFDGLVKLAFQLDDKGLKALARSRLDTLLNNVGTNTIAYLWWYDRTNAKDVEDAFRNGGWRFWTAGISERALAAWWEATGDPRVPRVLANVYGWQEMAERMGGNSASLTSALVDAYRLTREPAIARAIETCRRKFPNGSYAQYTQAPWEHLGETLNLKRCHLFKYHIPDRHGVGASEALLSILRLWQFTGDAKLRDAVLAWYGFFDRTCRQPYGVTAMDEEWGWAGAKRGTETCDVAAETFARENILAALGDGKWGDDVERAFFNAGPACVSRDFKRHVYFQMPNRTGATGESAEMSCPWDSHLRYGLSVWPLCCTAALNRILPNYVQYMWLRTADGGVAAALYGPSTFETELPSGPVALVEDTAYPFRDTIDIRFTRVPGAAFPLRVRIPAWCGAAEVSVNGERVEAAAEKGFVKIARNWARGDRVSLRLAMSPRLEEFRDMNELGRVRRSVTFGPLLFAYAIPAKDDNTPAGAVVEPELPASLAASEIAVVRETMPKTWDWPERSSLRLRLKSAGGDALELVPYGCTKLRISAFGIR